MRATPILLRPLCGERTLRGDQAKVHDFIGKIFKNVRSSTHGRSRGNDKFAERRGIGDVLVTFEAETRGTEKVLGRTSYDVRFGGQFAA